MGKLLDEIKQRADDYILVADVLKMMADATDTPVNEVITYLMANKIDENLIVFYKDEYFNFEPSEQSYYGDYFPDTASAIMGNDANIAYFRKDNIQNFDPIKKWNIFSETENELITDSYGRAYNPQHYIKNREDEYLSVEQACDYISNEKEMQFTFSDLKQLSRHRQLTPCFYFRGYVGTFGSFRTNTDGLYTELLSGYFSFRNLAEYVDGGFEKPKVPQGDLRDGVIIFRILEKQTAEYADGDDGVFLFTSKPIGLADADEVALSEIPVSEIRFSKAEIDRFLASSHPQDDNPQLLAYITRPKTQSNQSSQHDAEPTGLNKKNLERKLMMQAGQSLACYLWGMDVDEQISMGDMVQQVKAVLGHVDADLSKDATIRSWLSDIAPDYAKKQGRPPKDAPQEISLLMKK